VAYINVGGTSPVLLLGVIIFIVTIVYALYKKRQMTTYLLSQISKQVVKNRNEIFTEVNKCRIIPTRIVDDTLKK
jgi:cell division protein FtsL